MRVRSTDTERRKVYQPNTNKSLNRKCWNTFMTWKTNSGKRDGLREIYHQKFINPHSSGVTNQMHSWVLSFSNEIHPNHSSPQNDIIKCILWFLIDASGDVVGHIFHNRTIVVLLNVIDRTPHNLCKCSYINSPILQTISRKGMSQTVEGVIVVWFI